MNNGISEIRPILSALGRAPAGAFLVALQIAFAMAIIANMSFVVVQRVQTIQRSTGLDDANVFYIESSIVGGNYDVAEAARMDLPPIRALPGVLDAGNLSLPPMSGNVASVDLKAEVTARSGVTVFWSDIDEHALQALGVRLAAGRNFTAEEIDADRNADARSFTDVLIVTRDLARSLFNTDQAVGRIVYNSEGKPARIIGVVENVLSVPWDKDPTRIAFFPHFGRSFFAHYYAVRTVPGRRDALMVEVERLLRAHDLRRAITEIKPLSDYVRAAYQRDRQLVFYLGVLLTLMLALSVIGIAALTSFHVTMRTKQIGTRRAVGARRGDIIRYFMLENWLVTSAGVMFGSLLALLVAHWLSRAYGLPRIQLGYVCAAVLVFWLLGQLAVILPARRAAAIAPSIATRTV